MSNTNVPAVKPAKGAIVQASDASAVLDEWVSRLPILDEEDLTARTLARVLNATELEDIFANPDLESTRDHMGQVVRLNKVIGRRQSNYGDDVFYLMYECTEPSTGETFTMASGSPYCAVSAMTAQARGKLPAYVKVVGLESKTKPGQVSLWFVFVRDPAATLAASHTEPKHVEHAVNTQEKFPHETAGAR